MEPVGCGPATPKTDWMSNKENGVPGVHFTIYYSFVENQATKAVGERISIP